MTGQLATTNMQTADYWVRQARHAVQFAAGMETLREEEATIFLEIGPKPTLLGLGRRCWPEKKTGWLASLRPPTPDSEQIYRSLAELYAQGAAVHWEDLFSKGRYHRLRLPTYPFQRQRYWLKDDGRGTRAERSSAEALLDYYRVEWHPQPRITDRNEAAPLPAATTIRQQLQPWFSQATTAPELFRYAETLQALDRLAAHYVAAALRELAGDAPLNEATLRPQTAPVHHKRLPRLLALLERAGYGQPGGNSRPVMNGGRPQETGPEFNLLRRCGQNLAAVLRGQTDPLQLLFPGGDMGEATAVYSNSVGARLMNQAMQKALTIALANWPAGRRLRVLEVGGGTGGATGYILPHLPAAVTDYLFTDISPAFLSRAQEQFSHYPFMRYRTFNVEKPPAEQGFAGEQFDLVIAFNVLHATQDLATTVGHIQALTAPGGILFLLENTAVMDWVEIIWGLTEDWWRFTDTDLRPDQPLPT